MSMYDIQLNQYIFPKQSQRSLRQRCTICIAEQCLEILTYKLFDKSKYKQQEIEDIRKEGWS
jgi:hypothetical protein